MEMRCRLAINGRRNVKAHRTNIVKRLACLAKMVITNNHNISRCSRGRRPRKDLVRSGNIALCSCFAVFRGVTRLCGVLLLRWMGLMLQVVSVLVMLCCVSIVFVHFPVGGHRSMLVKV